MKGWLGALSSVVYFIMGLLILIRTVPLIDCLSLRGFYWLVAGGAFYTLGILFFVLDNYFGNKKAVNMHDIFHVIVILGSYCHFWVMLKYVI